MWLFLTGVVTLVISPRPSVLTGVFTLCMCVLTVGLGATEVLSRTGVFAVVASWFVLLKASARRFRHPEQVQVAIIGILVLLGFPITAGQGFLVFPTLFSSARSRLLTIVLTLGIRVVKLRLW